MTPRLLLVTNDEHRLPVFFHKNENVFCFFDIDSRKFKSVSEAMIVEDEDLDIYKKMSEHLRLAIYQQLKKHDLPTDVAIDIFQYRGSMRLEAKIVEKYLFQNKTYFYYSDEQHKDIAIVPDIAEGIINAFKTIKGYLGIYLSVKVRGVYINVETLLRLIGCNNLVTTDSLQDAKAKDAENPRFWIGDSISWQCNDSKVFGIVKAFHTYNFSVITSLGQKKILPYDNSTIVLENIIPQESMMNNALTSSIRENVEDSLDSITLHKAKIKFVKVDKPYLSGLDIQEAKCITCPNCGILLREKVDNDFECVMCSQVAKMINQEGDIGLFILGQSPTNFSYCLEEAKCCGNCSLAKFDKNTSGFKRPVGVCEYTNQIIQCYNTCDSWIPIQPKDFYSNLKRNSTNFSSLIKNKQNRGINYEEYDYKEYSLRGKIMTDFSTSYELMFLDWKNKLIEKGKNIPISEF